jgi:hypothetical protein
MRSSENMTNANVAAPCTQHCRSLYVAGRELAAACGSLQAATDISDGNVTSCGLQVSYEARVRGIFGDGTPRSYTASSDLSASGGKRDGALDILSDDIASLQGNIEIVTARYVNFVSHMDAAIAFLASGGDKYDATRRVVDGEKKMSQEIWIGSDLRIRPNPIAHRIGCICKDLNIGARCFDDKTKASVRGDRG